MIIKNTASAVFFFVILLAVLSEKFNKNLDKVTTL